MEILHHVVCCCTWANGRGRTCRHSQKSDTEGGSRRMAIIESLILVLASVIGYQRKPSASHMLLQSDILDIQGVPKVLTLLIYFEEGKGF
jgi:hypothetical protein